MVPKVAPDVVAPASPHSIHSRAEGASVIQVETSRLLPWLMLSSILAGISLMGSFWAIWEMTHLERESRLMQQQLMDTEALLVRSGIREPSDFNNGVGNLQHKPK